MPLSMRVTPLPYALKMIRLACVPSQVRDAIIARVGVWAVTRLHSFGAMADECFENKGVYENKASFAFTA